MPIELTQIFVRADINTPWFHETFPQSHIDYVNTTYRDTGKRTGSFEVSEDGLMLTQLHSFSSEEAHAEFTTDPYLIGMLAQRNAYNEANNIYSFT
jgi:hypothetical protein